MVALVQAASQDGSLVYAWACQTVLLIHKGDSKDFRLFGLVEVLWKATTVIINQRLTLEIFYHDTWHGF